MSDQSPNVDQQSARSEAQQRADRAAVDLATLVASDEFNSWLDWLLAYRTGSPVAPTRAHAHDFERARRYLEAATLDIGWDVLGTLFKQLDLAKNGGEEDLGQLFTPKQIVDYMTEETIGETSSNRDDGRKRVCDPACGSGRFLIGAHQYDSAVLLAAVDKDPRCVKMAVVNAAIFGMDACIIQGDTLLGEYDRLWAVGPGYRGASYYPEGLVPTAAPPEAHRALPDLDASEVSELPVVLADRVLPPPEPRFSEWRDQQESEGDETTGQKDLMAFADGGGES